MKSLIISDLHHQHPNELINKLEKEIGKIVCLGDIETPEILRYLLEQKKKKRIIIGDHEYHHSRGFEIHSRSMIFDYEHYQDLWEDNPIEQDFVLKYGKMENNLPGRTKGVKVVDEINGRRICYVHGSLLENEPMHPGHNGIMWGRLYEDYNDQKKIANFEKMKKYNYDVLFRGHDHRNEIYIQGKNNDINKNKIESNFVVFDKSFKLESENRYIITIGAFENGNFAIFDEDNFTLEFKNLDEPAF